MNIAKILLETQAVKINTKDLFTYASGIKSPIYCDNRTLISFVDERNFIVDKFINQIEGLEFDAICATATAGIPWGSFIAQRINKPMIYVRSSKKSHGLKSLIEGSTKGIKNVVVIEDLISTGKSSLEVCSILKDEGICPVQVLSIFDYKLDKSTINFSNENQSYSSLSNLDELLQEGLLTPEDTAIILKWKNSTSS